MKNSKLAGLVPASYPKNKQWQVEGYEHFTRKLKQEITKKSAKAEEARIALEWLAKFNNEYVSGNVKKGDSTALHNTDELRKSCYDNNNRSNRDLFSIKQSANLISYLPEEDSYED
jgi:hypothetical protein